MLVDPKLVNPEEGIARILGIVAAMGAGMTKVRSDDIPGLVRPDRVRRGVYLIKHHSFERLLPESKNGRQEPTLLEDLNNYGVCDSIDQFMSKLGELLESLPNKLVISFTHIRKDAQPPKEGWRWHKWGPYVGNGTPSTEYLYDEPGFPDGVYTYHIYELLEGEYVEPAMTLLFLDEDRYKKYKEAKGAICPFCQSPESSLEFGCLEADGGFVFQAVKCLDCGKSWTDVYGIIRVEYMEGDGFKQSTW